MKESSTSSTTISYAQALSKILHGFYRDLAERPLLLRQFEAIEDRPFRFPNINPSVSGPKS